MSNQIKLVALDMDGTLFNNQSQISKKDQDVIRSITASGVEVVISTGRPYVGLPLELLTSLGIRYAITTNAAGIYELPTRKCIHAEPMEADLICTILSELLQKQIHMDVFINGDAFSQVNVQKYVPDLVFPDSIKRYISSTRTLREDIVGYIRENHLDVEKVTLNFCPLDDGTFLDREAAKEILRKYPDVHFLTGGYHNLEFTKSGVTKGTGLRILAEKIGCTIEQTMACGDSQNDLDIIKTAGIGVAMGNASEDIKKAADFVSRTNEESGVAYAIEKFVRNR